MRLLLPRGRGGPGGWWIVFEPELHIGEEIVVPDLAGWRRERMPDYPDTAYVTLAPDWVCEVPSPSTRRLDLHGKRPVYGREGVGHLWFVDPLDRTLEAFELRDGHWTPIATAKDDEPVSIRPFDAITFSLGDLWPQARQATGAKGGPDGDGIERLLTRSNGPIVERTVTLGVRPHRAQGVPSSE